MRNFLKLTTAAIVLTSTPVFAQTDGTADDDIDWSLYEDLGFEDENMKRFCSAKIEGLSPAKLISLGYDCLLYTSPSPRDRQKSRMPSSA